MKDFELVRMQLERVDDPTYQIRLLWNCCDALEYIMNHIYVDERSGELVLSREFDTEDFVDMMYARDKPTPAVALQEAINAILKAVGRGQRDE